MKNGFRSSRIPAEAGNQAAAEEYMSELEAKIDKLESALTEFIEYEGYIPDAVQDILDEACVG